MRQESQENPQIRYTPGEFISLIEHQISYITLRRWDKTGKLKAHRNAANRRYYTQEHFEKIQTLLELNNE